VYDRRYFVDSRKRPALIEGVNELQDRVFPSSEKEGRLRHKEDAAKPPYEGADGVVNPG